MQRPKSIASLKKLKFSVFPFFGVWRKVFGQPERNGFWIIYGKEKHGKTWFTLLLSELLSRWEKVIYISAEEGLSAPFVEAVERAKLDFGNKRLDFIDYVPLEWVEDRLSKQKCPKVIVFDNITAYQDELKGGKVRMLLQKYKKKALFIFLAHEDKGEPAGATAKLVKKFAKIIIRVEGLTGFVSGRCKGGVVTIDEEKAQLYHSTEINQQ